MGVMETVTLMEIFTKESSYIPGTKHSPKV